MEPLLLGALVGSCLGMSNHIGRYGLTFSRQGLLSKGHTQEEGLTL